MRTAGRNGKGIRRLSDGPLHCPGRSIAPAPLIVRLRREAGRVRTGVCLGRFCLSQLLRVEILPGGSLRTSGVWQGTADAGNGGDGGPLDGPQDFLFTGGLIAPGIALLGGDVCLVRPGVCLSGVVLCRRLILPVGDVHHLQGQVVPTGELCAPIINQAARLRGDNRNGVLYRCNCFRRTIGHFLGLGRRFRCRLQNVPHGSEIFAGIVHQPPDILAVLDAGALPLRPRFEVDIVLTLCAHRLNGGVALWGKNRFLAVQRQLHGPDTGHQRGVGFQVCIVGPDKLRQHVLMGLLVLVVPVQRVLDCSNCGNARAGHADLQPVLVGDGEDHIQLEGIQLVALCRNGDALAAVLVLHVLNHHQELVVPDGNTGRGLRLSGVPGQGKDTDPLQFVGNVISQARHLDTGNHAAVRLGHALNGQGMGPPIGQFLHRDQVIPWAAERAICTGDLQDTSRRIVGQKAGANVGHSRFRPAHDFLLFGHGSTSLSQ